MISIYQADIGHCRGCFACWKKTPGQCVIRDDMTELTRKYITADLILWSFPLYYFGMPSKMKAFLDRLLPTNLPFMTVNEDGASTHPSRYDLSHQRHVLISTCGFYATENNYDALLKQFEIIFGQGLARIICPEGELLRVPQLAFRVAEYLSSVRKAGEEFALHGSFSGKTKARLSQLLYPPETFMEMANASWGIAEPAHSSLQSDQAYNFMRQMAAIYNPSGYVKDIVLEMYFTDLDRTYQLLLGKERCIVKTGDFTRYTTRIETSFELWKQISEGKVGGAEAMMKKRYRVLGDFATMLKMDEYFGSKSAAVNLKQDREPSKSNMSVLLLQWIILWVLLPLAPAWGGAAGIVSCTLVPLLRYRFQLTVYDTISGVLVSALGLAALFSVDETLLICLSYLLFGVLWLFSCIRKIPLTADYSKNSYGGDQAFSNPLFLKTNRILTLAWGVLYLLLAGGSYFLLRSSVASYTGLINSVAPALLGVFTAWFSKWYPAKVARG